MPQEASPADAAEAQPGPVDAALALVGDQRLVVASDRGSSLLQIIDRTGQVSLTIVVTPDGPVLKVEGKRLIIQAEGDLGLEAEHLVLHARQQLVLSSGGDVAVRAAGDMQLNARIHNISATLGNVNVKANDDVRLNGERVLVNCDDTCDDR